MTAAKKAAGSSKAAAPVRAATSTTKKGTSTAKRTTVAPKKGAPKKATAKPSATSSPSTKRPAPATKKAAPATKATKATKKAAPAAKATAAKKVPATKAAAAKKAAPAAKATAAKKTEAKKAPAASQKPSLGPYAKEDKFLDEQRVLLLEERAIYSGQAVDLRAEADSLALEREPGDVQFDEESGEGGTVTVDRERNLALSAQASAAVEEIDDALRKIDRKTYGGCERCHQAIPKARLRALPFARLCVACKSGGLSRR